MQSSLSFAIPILWRRFIIFLVSLLPFSWLLFNAITQRLGADPAKTIVLFLGEWGMIFLMLTLSVTPFRRWFGWGWLVAHRRMLGLFALFYAFAHLLSYAVFILGLDFGRLAAEIIKRPYIAVGFPAIVILIMLGVTSTKKMMRRLGKSWFKLHQLVYLALFLAWIHVLWQVRSSYFDAVLYGVLTVVLLGARWFWAKRKNRRAA